MTARYVGAVLVGCVSVVIAACGGGSSGTTTGPAASKIPPFAKDFRPPASGCGSFPTPTPADPDGVIAQLPAAQRTALGGYTNFPNSTVKVLSSRWKDWKPTHPGPYRASIIWGQLANDFQIQMVDGMKAGFQKAGMRVDVRTTGNNLDVPQQLQLYNAAVQSGPDVIVLQSASPDAFTGPVDAAGAKGIPTLTLNGAVPSKSAVNVDGNVYLSAGQMASYTAKLLGGKGNILYVQGVAGSSPDSQSTSAWDAVVKGCPGLHKLSGAVYGA